LRIADWGLKAADSLNWGLEPHLLMDYGVTNGLIITAIIMFFIPQSEIRNPQSEKSAIRNPQ
jgi:hypothetical protein